MKTNSSGVALVSPFAIIAALLLSSNTVASTAEAEPAPPETESVSEPYPLEYWALRNVISGVEVSPDGKRLGLMKIPSRDGNPVIEIYDSSDLEKKPFRINAEPMEITSFSWVSDDVFVFIARQKVRDRIEGFNQGVYEGRFAMVDVSTEEIKGFDGPNPSIAHLLPDQPDKVIVSFFAGDDSGPGSKIKDEFRPRAYYEYNLKKGTKKLLIRGKLRLGNIDFDARGRPRIARGYDERSGHLNWYYRGPEDKDWEVMYRHHEDDWEAFTLSAIDAESPNHLYSFAQNGADKIGLWLFNTETKTHDELIYQRKDIDVYGLRGHSNYWTNPDTIVGVTWYKDTLHTEYWDQEEEAIHAQLEGIIPHAYLISISSRSRDGNTMIIYNAGPRDPGTYYLLKDGQIKVVGSRQPLLDSEQLADVEYITYQSRDKRTIPAFLTVPNTEPPYPLIVLPHGGPFVQETVVYDKWAQMLANNGYLVLQPQYRGSTGYGLEFYQSAFIDGGEGGYKMQDDKDDGALHLIKQGMVEPHRVAMFGWSYGGYAALVAASRTPQVYQCVIAGAAVSDPIMQVNYYRYRMTGVQQIEQLSMWQDSISPFADVAKVNIPILLIHGSVDQRVPPEHAKKYLKLLDQYEKSYKYLELDGADHFSNTLFYDHQMQLFGSMVDYLRDDCGPGGL